MVLVQTFAASWLLGHCAAANSGDCAAESQPTAASVRASSMLQTAKSRLSDGKGLVEDVEVESSDMDAAMLSAMGAAELKELRQMKRNTDAERVFTWVKVQKERRRQFDHMRDMEANVMEANVSLVQHEPGTNEEGVDCGQHRADSCAACPGTNEDKWSYCKGECMWHGDAAGDCVMWPYDPKMQNIGRVLIATGGGNIFRENSDGSDYRKFIDSNTPCPHMKDTSTQRGVNFFSSHPTGVAIDENEQLIFWTDWTGGSRVQTIDPASDPAGLNRHMLRWSFNASVLVAPLTGETVAPILTSGEVLQGKGMTPIYWQPEVKLRWPHFLALDKAKKKVYFTDKVEKKIQRCNYDGSEFELDFHTTKHAPGGIVVDSAGEKIYFADGHKIFYMPIDGGEATSLISSVGIIGGMDFDPVQNFIYWTSLGTTRNPGGVLRAQGYRSDMTKREWCGSDYAGKRYMSGESASCEHVVFIPASEYGMGQGANSRGPIMTPVDVKGDFANGVLFWSGKEIPGIFEGLGGKVYHTSLCAAAPEQSWERPSDGKPRGDFSAVATSAGDPMYPPYVEGIALFPQSFDYVGSVPLAGCKQTAEGFAAETPSGTTCHENYEWRDLDGKTCMDYAMDTSLCSASIHDADGMVIPGANAATEACCACGADRAWIGVEPTTTTTTTTPVPTQAPAGEGCSLEEDWYWLGSDQDIRDRVKVFADCLQAQCLDQDGSGFLWSDCAGYGLAPGDEYCDFDEDFGITLGQACPKSCGKC